MRLSALPRRARIDPKRFAPRAIKSQISRAKNQLEDAAAYREQVGSFFEQTVADVYELYEKRIHEMNALDFDDLLFRTVNVLELFPDVRRALPAARSAGSSSTSTRTPTTPSTGCCSCWPARSATSASSATTTSRSTASAAPTSTTSSTSSATSPARTVVKLEQNYRSTQTILSAANAVVSQQRGPQAQGAVDRSSARASRCACAELEDEHAEARYVASEIERLARRGHLARRHRGLLPDQRAEPRARGHARALRRRLPGDRRHQVLRARRDQGRARVPDAARQPAATPSRSRASSTRPSAASARRRSAACSRTRTRWASRCWRVAAVPELVPGPRPGRREGARPLRVDHGAAARAVRAHVRRRPARERARGDRLRRGARGRAHDRGAGPAREPPGAGRRRARVRRQLGGRARAWPGSPSSSSSCRSTRSRTRCATARASSR